LNNLQKGSKYIINQNQNFDENNLFFNNNNLKDNNNINNRKYKIRTKTDMDINNQKTKSFKIGEYLGDNDNEEINLIKEDYFTNPTSNFHIEFLNLF